MFITNSFLQRGFPDFYFERQREFQQIVKTACPDREIYLFKEDKLDKIPYAAYNNIIGLPFLFFFKTKDIPHKFMITGIDDPKLLSEEFLQQVADFVHDLFFLPKKTLSSFEKLAIRTFLLFIRDPKLSEDAKHFTLHHEMGHIVHGDYFSNFFPKIINPRSFLFGILSAALVLSFLVTSLLSLGLQIVLVIAAFVATYVLTLLVQIGHWSFLQRKEEMRADLWAVKTAPQCAKGGIYLMTCIIETLKLERKLSWKSYFLYSPSGDFRFNLSHPSPAERIQYLNPLLSSNL